MDSPITQISDPFWRRVLNHPVFLKDQHWTAEQLTALYEGKKSAVRDYWAERAGVFEFDADFDALTAANFAHLAVIERLETLIAQLDRQLIDVDREIAQQAQTLHAMSDDPNLLYYWGWHHE